MKIAFIGTRGIPANYGGFETFVEELSTRLVEVGYDVTVYCRKGAINESDKYYKGVKLVVLPTIKHKYFDTIAHTCLCVFHVIFTNTQIVYFCNAINSIFMIIPSISGMKTIINVDGLEWKRKKWNKLGKTAYRISERIATIFAHKIITDSNAIKQYYLNKYKKDSNFISYGANILPHFESEKLLKKHGLCRNRYVLYISRLEPENNAHILISAYEQVKSDMPLVIVGDAPYATEYIAKLKSTKDKRIKFLGFIYGAGCRALRSNAYLYIHGNEVGGTNPALLEAMAAGNCVIANGVIFNKEVVADAGFTYEPDNIDDLRKKIEYLQSNPSIVDEKRKLAIRRIKVHYNWDTILKQYDTLFRQMLCL